MPDPERRPRPDRVSRRIEGNSLFYEKIVPILLVVLAIGLVAVVVILAAVLLGFFPVR